MRYALIMAGGSGTRLWPMSNKKQPKQLIPFIEGKSLLSVAHDRLEGLIPVDNRYICAGESHKGLIQASLNLPEERFLGEPIGRDTLNALGYSAAILYKEDPEAVMAVFTSDHLIEPVDSFLSIVEKGFITAEENPDTLVTFGIKPTEPATGFGYLELGASLSDEARIVSRFREKPDLATATDFLKKGPSAYLWNSGMFVWRADTFLKCLEKFEPESYKSLMEIAGSWKTPAFEETRNRIFPELKKISVDFAVMEPASSDPDFKVASVPMPLTWLDIGSWPAYAETCPADGSGNRQGGGKAVMLDSRNNLTASSDNDHLITAIGCDDLIIIHTPKATLVCPKDKAQEIKKLHGLVGESYGDEYL
ncbi:MAG: hypothetical protein JEY99_05060 [Spirochaetales bacterium]|nr:hypothetical protein [Spirochaetales bacterium]